MTQLPAPLYEMDAYVVWRNSDLTEGRGYIYPWKVCLVEATARRIAKGSDVQGCNCRIEKLPIYKIDRTLYGPIILEYPTDFDNKEEEKLAAKRELIANKLRIVERLRQLGATEEELLTLVKEV